MSLQDGENGFVIVSCDGLTESVVREHHESPDVDINEKSVAWIKKKLEAIAMPAPNKETAKILAQTAFKEGSHDNISCMLVRIDPKETTAKYATVLDGHGGEEVSEAAYQLFDAVLNYHILLIKLNNLSVPLAKNVEEFLQQQRAQKTIPEIKALYENTNQAMQFLINSLSKDKDDTLTLTMAAQAKEPVLKTLNDLKQHIINQKADVHSLLDTFFGSRSTPARDFAIKDITSAERRLELLNSNVMDSFLNDFIAVVNDAIKAVGEQETNVANDAKNAGDAKPENPVILNKSTKIDILKELSAELNVCDESLNAMQNTKLTAEDLQILLSKDIARLQDVVSQLKVKSTNIPKVGWFTSALGLASNTTTILDNIDNKLIELSQKYKANPIKNFKK